MHTTVTPAGAAAARTIAHPTSQPPTPTHPSPGPRRGARRPPLTVGVAGAVAVAAAVAPLAPAGAQAAVPPVIDDPPPGRDTPVVHDPRLDDQLAAVPLVGGAVAEGYARYRRDAG